MKEYIGAFWGSLRTCPLLDSPLFSIYFSLVFNVELPFRGFSSNFLFNSVLLMPKCFFQVDLGSLQLVWDEKWCFSTPLSLISFSSIFNVISMLSRWPSSLLLGGPQLQRSCLSPEKKVSLVYSAGCGQTVLIMCFWAEILCSTFCSSWGIDLRHILFWGWFLK